jgi:hypothetical protein
VQDRDGGKLILQRLRFPMPSVAHIWADGGYGGRLVASVRKVLCLVVEWSAARTVSAASKCCHGVG